MRKNPLATLALAFAMLAIAFLTSPSDASAAPPVQPEPKHCNVAHIERYQSYGHKVIQTSGYAIAYLKINELTGSFQYTPENPFSNKPFKLLLNKQRFEVFDAKGSVVYYEASKICDRIVPLIYQEKKFQPTTTVELEELLLGAPWMPACLQSEGSFVTDEPQTIEVRGPALIHAWKPNSYRLPDYASIIPSKEYWVRLRDFTGRILFYAQTDDCAEAMVFHFGHNLYGLRYQSLNQLENQFRIDVYGRPGQPPF